MALFEQGSQFPPQKDVKRVAKYIRNEKIFRGEDLQDIYNRARQILKNSPHATQLSTLYTAVNLVDMLVTKPADMLVVQAPIFESGKDEKGAEQKALNRIIEENDMSQLIHEVVLSGGYRGDSWLKVHHSYRQDFSELLSFGGKIPADVKPEPILEAVNPHYVYPEESDRNAKKFKAVNIAYVVFEDALGVRTQFDPFIHDEDESETHEITTGKNPYLIVERHIPNYIFYQKFRLSPKTIQIVNNVQVPTYTIGEPVNTGRNAKGEKDIVETGVPFPLAFHVPYKAVDTVWEGISLVEMVEDILAAINDRISQISYILWKHSDPTAYGPDLSNVSGSAMQWGGKYIPLDKDDQKPGYMTWEAQLESAFRELDNNIGMLFMLAETPQFLFGTVLTNDKAGSGTSHTDGSAIKSRYLPITTKTARIRLHMDRAVRDALYAAQLLELKANAKVKDFEPYEATYPTITWFNGIPIDEMEAAEIVAIRTNGAVTMDKLSAIKRLENVNDAQAQEILDRIKDNQQEAAIATPDVFNEVKPEATPEPKPETNQE